MYQTRRPPAVMQRAPNPNAARLFHAWAMSGEAQQLIVDIGGLRSAHSQVKDRDDRKKLADIKLMKEDPEGILEQAEAVKKRYAEIFKV